MGLIDKGVPLKKAAREDQLDCLLSIDHQSSYPIPLNFTLSQPKFIKMSAIVDAGTKEEPIQVLFALHPGFDTVCWSCRQLNVEPS